VRDEVVFKVREGRAKVTATNERDGGEVRNEMSD